MILRILNLQPQRAQTVVAGQSRPRRSRMSQKWTVFRGPGLEKIPENNIS